MKVEWKQALLIAGGAAATGVALYYLLRDDGSEAREGEADTRKIRKDEATKEQVVVVLKEILTTQEKMKGLMKMFTQKFLEDDCTFEEACALVAKQHPDDPLQRYGLSMGDFDGLLDKYQHDPEVKNAVLSIMGSATPPNPSPQAYQVTMERLIEIHEYMRDELQELANEIKNDQAWRKVDTKVLTLSAQAFVGAKVQKKFGLASEDIESAVLLNHRELASSASFARLNMAIQNTMNLLIGSDAM